MRNKYLLSCFAYTSILCGTNSQACARGQVPWKLAKDLDIRKKKSVCVTSLELFVMCVFNQKYVLRRIKRPQFWLFHLRKEKAREEKRGERRGGEEKRGAECETWKPAGALARPLT